MNKIIDMIAAPHNWLADKDFIWWPFSFLRPKTTEYITFKHTLLMTLCFAGLSFIMFVCFAVANNALTADSLVSTFMFCFIGFLVWFNGVTKPFWNHRAKRLNS
jgi:hypothetical protein